MTYIAGKMRLMAMIAVFGFMLMPIRVTPGVTLSGLATAGIDFGIGEAMASGLICDCTTLANADKSADKAKEDDDKAKNEADKAQEDYDKAQEDYDKNKTDENKTALDEADKAKEDADKTKEDADKTKEDADKALADVSQAVVDAPCSCGGGVTGYWTNNSVVGSATPPGGSAPKAVRQIQGQ